MKDGLDAARAQPQADVDVFPAVLGERLVESADRPNGGQRHRHVRRPEVVAAVVPHAPDRRRQIVEALDLDRAASHDVGRMALGRAQMLLDEVGERQDVVVDEDDALPARTRDARVARLREPGVALRHDRQHAAGARANALDHRRSRVRGSVVDEHDLILAIAHGLLEARVEDSLEQRRPVVRAELNRRAHH